MRTKVICVNVSARQAQSLVEDVEELQRSEGWEIKEIIPLPHGQYGVSYVYVLLEQPSDAEFELLRLHLMEQS